MRAKLSNSIFYRVYNDKTIVFNTDLQKKYIFSGSTKAILDYFKVEKEINDFVNLFIKSNKFPNAKERINQFIQQLIDEKILRNIDLFKPMTSEDFEFREIRSKSNDLVSVLLETTYCCQERCKYCYCVTDKPKKQELTTIQYKKLLDDLAKMNVLELTFTGGDPFFRKDIFTILEYAKSKGFLINIFTNGLALSDEKIIKLKLLHIKSISFTIYSHIPEKHDFFTGVKGSFNKTIDAIKKCNEIGIKTNIKSAAMEWNKNDIVSVIELSKQLNSTFQVALNICGRNDGDLSTLKYRIKKNRDYKKILNLLIKPNKKENINQSIDYDNQPLCFAGKNSISINPYGEVFACNSILLCCGNIKQKNIADIWKNSTELKYIRSLRMKDLSECKKCKKKQFCHFCMGSALTETKCLTKKYDDACRYAKAINEIMKKWKEVKK